MSQLPRKYVSVLVPKGPKNLLRCVRNSIHSLNEVFEQQDFAATSLELKVFELKQSIGDIRAALSGIKIHLISEIRQLEIEMFEQLGFLKSFVDKKLKSMTIDLNRMWSANESVVEDNLRLGNKIKSIEKAAEHRNRSIIAARTDTLNRIELVKTHARLTRSSFCDFKVTISEDIKGTASMFCKMEEVLKKLSALNLKKENQIFVLLEEHHSMCEAFSKKERNYLKVIEYLQSKVKLLTENLSFEAERYSIAMLHLKNLEDEQQHFHKKFKNNH